MHIIFFNFAVGTPRMGPKYRTHYLAEEWVRMGHDVTVVGCSFSHVLDNPESFRGGAMEAHVEGVRYILLKVPRYRGSGAMRAVSFMVASARARQFKALAVGKRPPAVVVAASVYQTDNWAAHAIAKQCGACFLRETRDLWPLTLVEVGKLSPKHPFVRFIQSAEDYGYRNAEAVLTTLAGSYEYMASRKLDFCRWHYSPQIGAPVADHQSNPPLPSSHERVLRGLRSDAQVIFVYAGSFQPVCDFENLVMAAKLVEGQGVTLVLVGDGSERGKVEAMVRENGASNIKLLGKIDKLAVPTLLSYCDVGVMGFQGVPLIRFGISPNKLVDYSNSGLPHLVYADSQYSLTQDANCGLVVPSGDPWGLAQGMIYMRDIGETGRQKMGLRGREFVRDNCSVGAVAERYLDIARAHSTNRRTMAARI